MGYKNFTAGTHLTDFLAHRHLKAGKYREFVVAREMMAWKTGSTCSSKRSCFWIRDSDKVLDPQ